MDLCFILCPGQSNCLIWLIWFIFLMVIFKIEAVVILLVHWICSFYFLVSGENTCFILGFWLFFFFLTAKVIMKCKLIHCKPNLNYKCLEFCMNSMQIVFIFKSCGHGHDFVIRHLLKSPGFLQLRSFHISNMEKLYIYTYVYVFRHTYYI